MKAIKYILLVIVVSLYTVACDKTEEDKTPIQYLKTTLGGCNSEKNDSKKFDSENFDSEKIDTVVVSVIDDNIRVFVGKNYTCGAPFETQCETINDTVFMYIIDTCQDISECYERCICYYTFDFVFKKGKLNQEYKIILIDPRKEVPEIIEENNFQNNSLNITE